MAFDIVQHDCVATTNGLVKDAIKQNHPEGLVHCAFKQTQGYGRQGRTWESPYGGLYISFLLRPDVAVAQISTIALVAALAVRDAIAATVKSQAESAEETCANTVQIEDLIQVKWPNDVVCSKGKLCGISAELVHGALCIGIGINVFEPYNAIPASGKNIPAYVADLISRYERKLQSDSVDNAQIDLLMAVRDALVTSFEYRYREWERDGFASCVSSFRACMTLRDAQVEIVTVDGSHMATGVVQGIADDGRLILKDESGAQILIASGEAHISRIM